MAGAATVPAQLPSINKPGQLCRPICTPGTSLPGSHPTSTCSCLGVVPCSKPSPHRRERSTARSFGGHRSRRAFLLIAGEHATVLIRLSFQLEGVSMIRPNRVRGLLATVLFAAVAPQAGAGDRQNGDDRNGMRESEAVQLGPRPFYLVAGMEAGPLKDRLMQCKDGPFERTDFSIGHRGAALQFPEHTQESYDGGCAARRGHRRMRRDLHQRRKVRMPARRERPAYDDQHTRDTARRHVHQAVCRRGDRLERGSSSRRPAPNAAPPRSRVMSSRPCAARWTHSTRLRATSASSWVGPRAGARIATPAAAR